MKFISLHSALLLAALLCGCSILEKKQSNCSQWLKLENSDCVLQNPGKSYSFARLNFEDREAFRFELRSGEYWGNSQRYTFRSEINTKFFPPMGSEKWYRFSIFLPSDFPIENNRLVLAQWWAQTKLELGEVHRSPILHLRFSEGHLAILLRRYTDKVVKDEGKYIQTNLYEISSFPLGRWQDFVFHVKWSSHDDGFVDAWWNKRKVISFKGITENQDNVGPTFKFGLYRDDSPNTYVSYVSNVVIGDTLESIGSPLNDGE